MYVSNFVCLLLWLSIRAKIVVDVYFIFKFRVKDNYTY